MLGVDFFQLPSANRTGYEPANGPESAVAEFVAEQCARSAPYGGRADGFVAGARAVATKVVFGFGVGAAACVAVVAGVGTVAVAVRALRTVGVEVGGGLGELGLGLRGC